jgi:ribosomal protein S18 acetylase RimI-like enzyme
MQVKITSIPDETDCQSLAAFLSDRIYEFNAQATGYSDGKLLAGCMRDEAGEVIAGFNGHTWGGCCELLNVWVHEQYRAQGLGASLLRAAEAEAISRGCAQVVLATHSFQAPGFYERMGYEQRYIIAGQPKDYAEIIYVKVLQYDHGR